ncbi:hypothetical protein ACHAW6_005362, partial [Cyclotella cf. meneghiniana]
YSAPEVDAFRLRGDLIQNAQLSTSLNNKIYAHLHIAKTGGTYINQFLANKYEKVCGNKGNSVFYYNYNEMKKMNNSNATTVPMTREDFRQFRSMLYKIGFADCDYISIERSYQFWSNTFPGGKFHDVPVELHVPCRDPVDHMMSSCNWKQFEFKCHNITDEEVFRVIDEVCPVASDRYNHLLFRDFDIKCFDFRKQFTAYLDYMSGILQPRRFESKPFIYEQNPRDYRNKTNECIWEREDLMQKVKAHLLSNKSLMHHQYYQFCDVCLGSEQDLTRLHQPDGK